MNQLGNPKLFHVSEEQDIDKFIPRYSTHTDKPVVWAISENKLANYLGLAEKLGFDKISV